MEQLQLHYIYSLIALRNNSSFCWFHNLRLKNLSKFKYESKDKSEKERKKQRNEVLEFLCTKQKANQNQTAPNSEISMKCLLLKTRPNQLQVWWNLVTTHLKMSTNTPNWKYSNTWSSLITIQKFLQTSNLNCFCDLWSKTLAHLFFHNSNDYTTRLNKN